MKNFGNAMNSRLTGGVYLTGTIDQTYKGQLKGADGKYAPYYRPFLNFIGEGDTSNAVERDLGLHPAILLEPGCYRHEPSNPLADDQGDIFYGDELTYYYDGRTEGCVGVREEIAKLVMSTATEGAMVVYIYPESRDIKKVAKAVASGVTLEKAGTYWNKDCLKEIGAPKFWDHETYDQPIQAALKQLPPPSPRKMCGF